MDIKLWLLKSLPEWCDDVPFQVKAVAVRDACLAVKAAKRRHRETKRISHVSFRCRKDAAQTIFIPKTAMHQTKGPYHTMLGEMRFSEVVPPPQGDCRLTCRSGRWFVTVPVETTQQTADNQGRWNPHVRHVLRPRLLRQDRSRGLLQDSKALLPSG